MGWIARDQVSAEQENAIFAAPVGSVSQVLTLSDGLYIFKVSQEAGGRGWHESVLYNFMGTPDGNVPVGLTPGDKSRTYYITTQKGGSRNRGGIFKFTSTGGIGQETAESIAGWEKKVDLGAEMKRVQDFGCRILVQEDEEYPPLLREIYDPPIVTYGTI